MTQAGPPRRHFGDMTTANVAALDPARVISILPVAAIEQHGPHLPLVTDACINAGILARALDIAPPDLQVTALPMLPVGKSDEHRAYPGTLTLANETLIRLWTEVGDSLACAGLRKLVIFNSHGGQVAAMDVVARDLRLRHGMLVMAWSWFGGGLPEGLFPADEMRFGIHAGAIETSLMLHLRPDLVDMSKAGTFEPLGRALIAEGYQRLSPVGNGRMGWMAQDLHPSGACGDATAADADRGRAILEHAAAALVDLLQEMDRFPLERLQVPSQISRRGPRDP